VRFEASALCGTWAVRREPHVAVSSSIVVVDKKGGYRSILRRSSVQLVVVSLGSVVSACYTINTDTF
jgi:hypothetical protein